MVSLSATTCTLALVAILPCLFRPLSASLVGQCSASSASCTGSIMDDAEDDGDMTRALGMDDAGSDGMVLSLLQVPMGKKGQLEPVRADRGTPGGERERLNQFDCEAHSRMCREPFNCHRVPDLSAEPSWMHGNATEGLAASGPNMQAWCSVPRFEGYIHTCLVEKDLAKAARLQYEGTKAGKYGPYSYELDGSYCFIEGHCLNTRVSHSTTLEEASQMCDERYGRSRWANFGSWLSHDVIGLPEPKNASNGFDGQENTAPFLLAGCAMGNYHCDVMYCRETYCKDEYMVEKYGSFLRDLGWADSEASWMRAQPARKSLRGQRASQAQVF